MLDIREIEYWISRYEQEADKLDQCVILAALYACRDKLTGNKEPASKAAGASMPPVAQEEPLGLYGDSEFLRAVGGKEPAGVWAVMDELMETLRVVNARAYQSVMRKIGAL